SVDTTYKVPAAVTPIAEAPALLKATPEPAQNRSGGIFGRIGDAATRAIGIRHSLDQLMTPEQAERARPNAPIDAGSILYQTNNELKQLPPLKIQSTNLPELARIGLREAGVEFDAQNQRAVDSIVRGITSIEKRGSSTFRIGTAGSLQIPVPNNPYI